MIPSSSILGWWMNLSPSPVAGALSLWSGEASTPKGNKAQSCELGFVVDFIGAGERNRTLDLLITNDEHIAFASVGMC
jgi:hypothetical protein